MFSLDIHSKHPYPANALSNFYPHAFTLDTIHCASMEGFLQSLKFEDAEIQKEVCGLIGKEAKTRGEARDEIWKNKQTLWWQGKVFPRDSVPYQELLDRAFDALAMNVDFQNALRTSKRRRLIHSIGKSDMTDTVLTKEEFCSRLMRIRGRLFPDLRESVFKKLLKLFMTKEKKETKQKSSLYQLRQATEKDLLFLFNVSTIAMLPVRKKRNPNLTIDKEKELQEYKKKFIPKKIQVIQWQGKDIGRLRVVRKSDEIYIGGLQILPSFQKKGIGSAILQDIKKEAQEKNIPIRLEVSLFNEVAQKWYRQLGFTEVGKEKTNLILRYKP